MNKAPTRRGAPQEFLLNAVSTKTNSCVIWPFSVGSHGYGQVWWNNKMALAHRISLTLAAGPPPEDSMDAAHSPAYCNHRSCINPDHLRWATRKENEGDKLHTGARAAGERNGHSKLSDQKVRKIILDSRTQRVIAAEFGVSQSVISFIKSKKIWKHIHEVES